MLRPGLLFLLGCVPLFGCAGSALAGDRTTPDPGSCIADAALASEGTIVALQCSGTMFGASD